MLICFVKRDITVSYTHLVGGAIVGGAANLGNYMAGRRALKNEINAKNGGNLTVSYTHLDVYKRQQVYTTNTIMEFNTTQSFVKSLEGVYESEMCIRDRDYD